jgi:hypothetical protein
MPLRFPYLPLPTHQPVLSLGGAKVRHRPVLAIWLSGPSGTQAFNACVDSACDDTIFPQALAVKLGIDSTGAVQGEARTLGGTAIPHWYSRVSLRITDGIEECKWEAIVGFADVPMRWGLLGHAGFLDFFDTELLGARRETTLTPNSVFPGQHTIVNPPPPP